MTQVFLASGNAKKLAELQRILVAAVPGIDVIGVNDVEGWIDPVEDEPTFAGNALIKARAGVALTGLPSLADDSGLCVDALNGMPGVLSARWSGPPLPDRQQSDDRNNALLLAQLSDVPDERRTAHFVCSLALCLPDGSEQVIEGRMDGRITRAVAGGGGFGYDVVFVADEYADSGLTTAELSVADKDAISHRGRALRAMAPVVAQALHH